MGFYRCESSLAFDSGAATDVACNVWHFRSNDVEPDVTEAATIGATLDAFYSAIQDNYSDKITGEVRQRVYRLTDGEPRVPVVDTVHTITPGTGHLPNEVAICLSFRGEIASGVNRRRNRGRVYIGPIVAVDTTMSGDAAIGTGTMAEISGAAQDLIGPHQAGSGSGFVQWCVFSRAEAGVPIGVNDAYSTGQLADAFRDVVAGYVDNAYDTQRRRGQRATARDVFG